MKNIVGRASYLLFSTLAAIASASTAEEIKQTEFNTPELINSEGSGAIKKFAGIKIEEATLIVRSSPVQTFVELIMYKNKNNYDVHGCKTPCLFKIPDSTTFSIRANTPDGYSIISKPSPSQWTRAFFKLKLKPDDVSYVFKKIEN